MDIKKIGAVLATIIATIIRWPASVLAFAFIWVDKTLIKLNVILARYIGGTWRESLYWAMEPNIRMAEHYVIYFEDLQEDLA